MDKPKSRVDIIIADMKPRHDAMQSSDVVEQDIEASDGDIMKESAAEELIQAIKLGDAKAVSEALQHHHDLTCGEHGMEQVSEME